MLKSISGARRTFCIRSKPHDAALASWQVGTLKLSCFLRQIFPTNSSKMYLQQKRPNIYYHQRRISTNEQILAGNHFYGSCGDHCCGGTLLLSYSPRGRKFRYVLFSSGILGGGGEYWQFFGVFVGHWQLVWSRSERSTRAFSQQTELVIGRLLRTWQTARTKIWADAKP